jgi:hypothetical protein
MRSNILVDSQTRSSHSLLGSLILLAAVAPMMASADDDALEEFSAFAPISFYPSATITFTPPPSITLVQAELLEDGATTQYGSPTLASPDGDGIFQFDIACHFVGPGRVQFSDPAIPGDEGILGEVTVYCGLSSDAEQSTQPLPLASPPVSAAGRLTSFRYERSEDVSKASPFR